MGLVMRQTLLALLTAAALLPAGGAWAQTYMKTQPRAVAAALEDGLTDDEKALVDKGAYVARAADCLACHTAVDGPFYAGGRAFGTAFGTIYSANITSDPETGIGGWSEADFEQAVRHGVDAEGEHLYPAMPYTAYAKLSDADVHALWAYIKRIRPVNNRPPENDLAWPLGWRFLMTGWNLLFFDDDRFEPDPQRSPEWNRGRYLVEGPGHCGVCHTPRNLLMAEKTREKLTGETFEGWYAPSLVAGKGFGISDLSVDELTTYLQTGLLHDNAVAGPMAEVVEQSLQKLRTDDLRAIAIYLKSLHFDSGKTVPFLPGLTRGKTVAQSGPAEGTSVAWSATPNRVADPVSVRDIPPAPVEIGSEGGLLAPGERLYMDNCMACHLDGQGAPGAFPALVGNGAVVADEPNDLLMVILHGAQTPQTDLHPTVFAMPNFDWRLSDEEVATLADYVRRTFGRKEGASVDVDLVAELRKERPDRIGR